MAIPDYQSLMRPLLQFAADCAVHSIGEAREALATALRLTPEDRSELLPSGRQPRFDNRVAWARVYLDAAGLLWTPRRGHFQITDSGRAVAANPPDRTDIAFLERFEPFREFRAAMKSKTDSTKGQQSSAPAPRDEETPEEVLERSFHAIQAELHSELLARIKKASPAFFERLVVELLLKMGCGRSRAEAGRAIGASGDEGIDGVISEDRLGLETIYIQAKRWEGTVGRPEIQKFVGALHGKRARKGVFLTTGRFTEEARDFVSRIDPRVVLIDGRELVEFMVAYDLGVSRRVVYELKRIDSDYFDEE
jgi:restriction system protein